MGEKHKPMADRENRQELMKKTDIHYIEGDTFKHKDKLKNMGCRWDAEKKMWCTLDPYIASMARVLVDDRLSELQVKSNRKK